MSKKVNYKGIGTRKLAKMLSKVEAGDIIFDKAFNPHANGVTRYSLAIWEVVKKHVDITGFTQAKMTYSVKDHYRLTLNHVEGWRIVFHGVSAGYYGEGSRGAMQILAECGFSNAGCVYVSESFTLRKRAYIKSLKSFQVELQYKNGSYIHKMFYACKPMQAVKLAQQTFPHLNVVNVSA